MSISRDFVAEFGSYADLKDMPDREVYVEGHLASEQIVILHGPEKSGKSYFASAFSIMCASGEQWGHLVPAKPLRVLYVLTEGNKDDIKERADPPMERWEELAEDRWRWFHIAPIDMKTVHNPAVRHLTDIVKEFKPELFVLDSLYSSIDGDITKNEVIGTFHATLRYLQGHVPGMAIMIVHHDHRQRTDHFQGQLIEVDEGKYSIYGSTFIRGMADHIWHFKRTDSGAKVTPVGNRSRMFEPEEFWLDWEPKTGALTPQSWSMSDKQMTDLRNWAMRSKRFTTAQAISFMGMRASSGRTTQGCLTKMESHGMIKHVPDAKGGTQPGIWIWTGGDDIELTDDVVETDTLGE